MGGWDGIMLNEVRVRQILHNLSNMWNLKANKIKIIGVENRLLVARKGGNE